MRLLEIAGTDPAAWNMPRDCKHCHGPSMTIEQPVDEMKVAGTATAGTDGKPAGDVRIGARGKGCDFLMADVDPLDRFLSAYLVGYPVVRIADYSVDSLNTSRSERGHQPF